MSLRTIPARDPCSRWGDALIGAMARKRTLPVGMNRAALQGCIPPGFSGNVFLAGEACFESKLHRPPARTGAAVAGHSCFEFPVLSLNLYRHPTGERDEKYLGSPWSHFSIASNCSPVKKNDYILPVVSDLLGETTDRADGVATPGSQTEARSAAVGLGR